MKKLHIIYTASFVNSLMLNGMLLALVFYAKSRFGATPTQTGQIVFYYNLAYVAGCLLAQGFLSRFTPQKNLVISMLCFFAASLLCYFGTGMSWLYLGQVFYGIGTSFFWPPLMGWFSEGYEGKQLARMTGFYNLTWSSANFITPLMMGYLCDLNVTYPLILLVVVYAIQLPVFIAIHLANRKQHTQATHQEVSAKGKQTMLRFPSWYGVACAWCIIGFLLGVYPNAAKEILNISSARVGFFYTLRSTGQAIALVALGIFTFWQFKRWQLFVGHFAAAVTIFTLGFAKSEMLVLTCLIILGPLFAHAYTNSLVHGVAGSKNRTRRAAIHEILLSSGSFLGALLGGYLYQHFGLVSACSFCAVLMTSAAICDLFPWKDN